jgi:serine/threonine protein kinase
MHSIDERLVSALLGRYTLLRQLGAGAMASVYLADDLRHERQVAIKVLEPDLTELLGPDRFLREIRTIANLQHPGRRRRRCGIRRRARESVGAASGAATSPRRAGGRRGAWVMRRRIGNDVALSGRAVLRRVAGAGVTGAL